MLVDADVPAGGSEPETVIPTVERIEANSGQQPEKLLADGAFATGSNLSQLADRGVEAYMPVESHRTAAENPAVRNDPTQPVPAPGTGQGSERVAMGLHGLQPP
jgi:hypothetical protein